MTVESHTHHQPPVEVDDLRAVTTWMPAPHVLAFQERAAAWLQELASDANEPTLYEPPHFDTYGPRNAWDLPSWTLVEDRPAAHWIVNDLSPHQRRILAATLGAGESGIWTSDLKQLAGFEASTASGPIFKAIGGRFRRVGRRPAWNGGRKQTGKGQLLSVKDRTVRTLFSSVIRDVDPDMAAEFGL